VRGRALFERMVARRPVGIFQCGPDALVHLGHANIHCDKSNAKFVFHGRAQEYTVNLDRAGLSHWHGSVAGQGLALGRSELVKVAPYVHDEKPLSERDRVAAIHSGCRLVRSATTVDPHVTGKQGPPTLLSYTTDRLSISKHANGEWIMKFTRQILKSAGAIVFATISPNGPAFRAGPR
jgi:hypothetical protein